MLSDPDYSIRNSLTYNAVNAERGILKQGKTDPKQFP